MKNPIDKLYSPTERAIAEMVRKERAIYLLNGQMLTLAEVWEAACQRKH